MKCLPASRLVALLVTMPLDGAAQVQQSRSTVLRDSARFRGAEWEVVPIVRLDSSKTTDTMAVREVRRVYWLAPGRLVYEGRLAKGGKRALFGVVDGVTRRLVVSGQEFTEPDGRKKKINLDQIIHSGPGFIAMVVAVEKRSALFVTDGALWRHVLMQRDTITLAGTAAEVDHFALIDFERDCSLLLRFSSRAQQLYGIVRLTNRRADRVLMQDDSLPGIARLPYQQERLFGLPYGVMEFIPRKEGRWLAVVRTHEGGKYVEHVVLSDGSNPARVLLRTEPFGMREENSNSIRFVALSPAGEVVLQRGQSIGVIGADGTWRPLLGPEDVRDEGGFALRDVAWIDRRSSRGLLSIWLSETSTSVSSQGSLTVSHMWSPWPKLYYFDGTRATEVRADTTMRADGVFTSMSPSAVVHSVPGYDEGVILHHPLVLARTASPMFFDAERSAFAPAPAFRTGAGDIGLQSLVAWNGDNEAIVRLDGGLALVRRQ